MKLSNYNMNYIKCINKIAEKILPLDDYDKSSGFWECILKYKLDNIGIMDKTNNQKKFDSITSIYKFLNKSKDFCLKYSLKKM